MSLFSLFDAPEINLIFSLAAPDVFTPFRLLRFPGLTMGGSFPFGGAVHAALIVLGWDPCGATLVATAVGVLTGLATGLLNVKLKIMDLLTNILMMTALYSISLRIMDKPNVPLIAEPTLFTLLQPEWLSDYVLHPLLLVFIVIVAKLLLDRFFTTQKGLATRATGSSPRMARTQGVNIGDMILFGMAISNTLVALADTLFTQTQDGADISMGIGTIVIDLAAMIAGGSVLSSRRLILATLAMILGAIVYRFFIALALNSGFIDLQVQDLNLVTAVSVTVALVIPMMKKRLLDKKGA